MNRIVPSIVAVAAVLGSSRAPAQVVGAQTLGVSVAQMKEVVLGWSVKKDMLGKTVYNEKNDKVGTIDDIIIIIAPDRTASYVIIGAGGFVGLAKHDVAIPMTQLTHQDESSC